MTYDSFTSSITTEYTISTTSTDWVLVEDPRKRIPKIKKEKLLKRQTKKLEEEKPEQIFHFDINDLSL